MRTTPQRRRTLAGLLASLAACSETTTPAPTPIDAGVDAGPAPADAGPAPVDAPPARVDAGVMPSGVGDECESEGPGFPPTQGSCRSGQLCLSDAIGFRGGYCVTVCQGARCPRDAACSRIQGFPVCLRTCAASDDCRRAEGYVCRPAEGGGGARVCQVNDAPPGVRPDGSACFGAGGARPAPALARVIFSGPNGEASGARTDSFIEAEGNVAVHPTNGHIAVSYISANVGGQVYMGTSRLPGAGARWFGDGTVRDPQYNSSSDPVLDYGLDGVLRMTFLGLQRSASSQVTAVHVRVTESRDDGATWSTPRQVDPAGVCPQGTGGICDKPWLLSAPGATAGAPTVLYLGYLAQGPRSADLVVQRSDDAGATWSPTIRLAAFGFIGGVATAHNLIQFAAGPGGLVAAAWAGLSVGDGSGGGGDSSARFGSPSNRVLFRRSRDGFRTLDPLRVVSRPSDAPVYAQPPVALDGADTAHVVYVTGDATGAWDVILATSTDGGDTWRHRKVNDDPESCALHMLPSMVVDRVTHDVHVTWMENRFGEGAVAYARCPGDAATPCGRNEQVSDRPFRLSSSRNPQIWHGDYNGLTLSPQGELWATWSDTRTGSPAMYTAHGRARPAE